MSSALTRRAAVLALLCGSQARPNGGSGANVKHQFFRGAVSSFDASHVTIWRKLVGRRAETRVFLIRPETKMDGSLQVQAKVTVHYEHQAEGDVALEIRFHSAQPIG